MKRPHRTGSARSAIVTTILLLGVTRPPGAAADAGTARAGEDTAVTLPQFEVSTAQDQGYRAGNSVSATRINTPIKDLPFTLNAYTRQFIDDIGATDLVDIVNFAPGVAEAGRGQASGNSIYTIRGFQNAPQINGLPTPNSAGQTNTSGPNVDTVGIERVEVVKGPASLLYGQVNPGGTINYITKTAGDRPAFAFGGLLGSSNRWRATADVNQPLVPGKLLFRLNVAEENGAEWIDHATSRTTAIVPTLTWKVADRLSLKLDYSSLHRLEKGFPNTPLTNNIVAAPGANGILSATGVLVDPVDRHNPGLVGFYPLPLEFNSNSANDYRRSNYQTFAAEAVCRLTDTWVARLNATRDITYVGYKATGLQSGSVSLDVPASFLAQSASYAQAARLFADAILKNPAVARQAPHQQVGRSQYFRDLPGLQTALQGEVVGRVDLGWAKLTPLAGIYYDGGRVSERRRQSGANGTYALFTAPSAAAAVPAPAPWDFANPAQFPISFETDFDPGRLPYTQYTTTYLYDRAQYASVSARLLQERLIVHAGFRYNESDQRITNYLTNPPGTLASPTYTPHFRETKPTYQLAAGYKVTRDVMLYASYSESYFAIASLANSFLGPQQAKPTTGRGYEAGVKLDLNDGRISATLSAYEITQKDRAIGVNYVLNGINISDNFQGTSDRSRGVEGEVTWSPTDRWQVIASAALDDFRTVSTPAFAGFFQGTTAQDIPKVQANLWTRYTFRGEVLKGLWLGGGVNYNGKKAGFITNPAYKLPAVALFRVAAGYDWTAGRIRMSALLQGENITDESYYATVQEAGLPARVNLSVRTGF